MPEVERRTTADTARFHMNHHLSQLWLRAIRIIAAVASLGPDFGVGLAEIGGVQPDPSRPAFVFKAEKPLVISEPIRIPREVASVCTFVVEDGPAATDAAFNGAIVGACLNALAALRCLDPSRTI